MASVVVVYNTSLAYAASVFSSFAELASYSVNPYTKCVSTKIMAIDLLWELLVAIES